MKAFQIKYHAHPREHKVSEIPPPVPGPGQVLVDVYAAGLNFFDVLQAQNLYQRGQTPLPFTLGVEFAGRISSHSPIPPGCRFKRGDRVIGRGLGAYAEQNVASPSNLLPLPDNLSYEQGAAFYVAYPTSYEAIVGRGRAKPGEWVLVHAAAGGVGIAAVQIAKGLGCKVIGTASTDKKRNVALAAGCDYVLDYTQPWQDEVKRISGGGVDIVYDPVGLLVPSLKVVKWNARLLVVGFAGGTIENVPANLVLLKNVEVLGVRGGETSIRDPGRYAKTIEACFDMVAGGKVRPVLHERIYEGLEELAQGLEDLESRKVFGKAVVRIRREDGSMAKL